tara:strand:+ start:145 stop:1440 length:1296 start_codon:yes stop_codon:yes gene_type:complete
MSNYQITIDYIPNYLAFNYRLNNKIQPLIINSLFQTLRVLNGRKRKLQLRHLKNKKIALDYIFSSLIVKTKLNTKQRVYRTFCRTQFTEEIMGYRQFIDIINILLENNYLTRTFGKKCTNPFDKTRWMYLEASHLTITKRFIYLCNSLGINHYNYRSFFTKAKPRYYVEARCPSKRIKSVKLRGRKVSLSVLKRYPQFKKLNLEMEKINDFLFKQNLKGGNFNGLVRKFNDYRRNYHFHIGGRLTGIGEDNYQLLKKKDRKEMKINGEKVTEIDIQASHLTILHGLLNKRLPDGDLYFIKDLHRDIVKYWITISISKCKLCTRWPSKTKKKLEEKGHDMETLTASTVLKKVIEKYPLLEKPKSSFGWGCMQFIESDIILNVMKEFIFKYNLPIYPVHDSLIVMKKYSSMAASMVKKVFKNNLNIIPKINEN